MDTFYYILQKIINNTTNIYDFREQTNSQKNLEIIFKNQLDECEEEHSLVKIFFPFYIKNLLSSKNLNKITFIMSLLNNVFNRGDIKQKMLIKFNKIQKIYFAFSKLANIYKFKKSKCLITTDLYFNILNINDPNVIQIYQNKTRYLFTSNDLIHLLIMSLSNSSHFFINPLECKNPYNNIPFSKYILYNIYFFIKKCNVEIPELIQKYFIEDFDLSEFVIHHKLLIQTVSIKEYVLNLSTQQLYNYGLNIINHYNSFFHPEIIIHTDFPKQKVADAMKPFILINLISKYSVDSFTRSNATIELNKKIKLFYKYNPLFGRKYIKIITNELNQKFKQVSFNDSLYNDNA